MRIYEHRIYNYKEELSYEFLDYEVREGEYEYYPTEQTKEDYKKTFFPIRMKKEYLNKPHRTLKYYSVYSDTDRDLDTLRLDLIDYIYFHYQQEHDELDKRQQQIRRIQDKVRRI